jgi:hypothetical protein
MSFLYDLLYNISFAWGSPSLLRTPSARDWAIIPGIGGVGVADLTARRIQLFYKRHAQDGLSAQSVWCVHLLLRRCLGEALHDGLIPCNPAAFCDVVDQQHFLCALIRQFTHRIWHQYICGVNRLHKQPIVINTADDLSSVIENIFSHHSAAGNTPPSMKTSSIRPSSPPLTPL